MQEKSPIKKNILQFLDYKGITKYKFYQLTGITRGVLDQNNGMSEENIAKTLAYFDEISPDWLILGKGEMIRTYNQPTIDTTGESRPCKLCMEKERTIEALKSTISKQDTIIELLSGCKKS